MKEMHQENFGAFWSNILLAVFIQSSFLSANILLSFFLHQYCTLMWPTVLIPSQSITLIFVLDESTLYAPRILWNRGRELVNYQQGLFVQMKSMPMPDSRIDPSSIRKLMGSQAGHLSTVLRQMLFKDTPSARR